ncbi:saccharopine dehydrogenase C-terminal domain-containing protein [Rhodospirillum sp. A1_3_36]|uniref:saccharopine dehydrogenase family protein n=1 Tax=Rhodospirillum sp. A1_3_36 TaxID=3391666 RepID=UPI0039A555F7
MFQKIAVLGLGKVGHLAATLLSDAGFQVTGFDARVHGAEPPFARQALDVSSRADLDVALSKVDAVLSCLPFHLNIGVAQAAHAAGIHYFDLTEDVSVTKEVRSLAKTAKGLMAPQCGLAPGFIGIVGAHLAQSLETVRSIKLRVGALPRNPTGLLGYAFNWSPEGVVNEYLNDCEVIEGGERKWVSSMEWLETVYVEGTRLEAFTTSGGLGTMCETYHGTVANLDYKTLRYPGHVALMNFFFHELLMRDRREDAGQILTHAKPPVNDDVVFIHASAEGVDDSGPRRHEFVRAYRPLILAGEQRTAIAWTTAASACSVIQMTRDGQLPASGFLKQEDIPLDTFQRTSLGGLFAG